MEIEWEEIPAEYDLDGRLVKFKDELEILEYPDPIKKKDGSLVYSLKPTGKVLFKTRYMLVSGGFGAFHLCSGTMICGYFAPSPEECRLQVNGRPGNTRHFPHWQEKL